jgi:flagellin-like protein
VTPVQLPNRNRGVTPVVGAVLLVGLAVVLAVTTGVVLRSTAGTPDEPVTAELSMSVTPDGRVTLVHRGGATLDVDRLRLRIAVEGTPLKHQPPVPFFAARGFRAGPTGPFNRRSSNRWSAGQRASIQVASTNDPSIVSGKRIRARVVVGDHLVWEETTVVGDRPRSAVPDGGCFR